MKRGRVVSLLGGLAIGACLLGASAASAATLVGDYQFQGTRSSSGPGPALVEVGSGGGASFQNDSVQGTSRQVLAFPEGTGLAMSPSVGTGDVPYSVVTTFHFNVLSGYARILDATNALGTDEGFYAYDNAGSIYGASEAYDGAPVFSTDAYSTVVLTSQPPLGSSFYVNGARILSLNQTFPVTSDTLRIFKDDDAEDAPGRVSCIRVYKGALSDDEVSAIGSSATCGTVSAPTSPPATTKKKCKKHKKKRSAESAKKKKCKKKKKR
jgi:Concanavalin A-like lectin/glucanases superfamily